jgi:hypothetical protein
MKRVPVDKVVGLQKISSMLCIPVYYCSQFQATFIKTYKFCYWIQVSVIIGLHDYQLQWYDLSSVQITTQ